MNSTPVKNPKLPITTVYFKRDGETFRTYSSDAVRAAMLAEGHLILDHYLADTAQIYDSHTGELYFEKVRSPAGINNTFKCDPTKLNDPMRKKRRAADFLLAS